MSVWPRHPELASTRDSEGSLNPAWKDQRAPNMVAALPSHVDPGDFGKSPTGRGPSEGPNAIGGTVTGRFTGRGAVNEAAKPAGEPIEVLLTRAKKLGYKELPNWPNGGVRAMRVKNFLRNHASKGVK